MTKQRLYLAGVLGLWLVVLIVVAIALLDDLAAPTWGNPVSGRLSAEVTADTHVGQRFTAPLPGLYRIDVAWAQATASQTHRLTFHLKADPETPEDLWSTELSSDTLTKNEPMRFEFPPIRNSQGQTYYFYLESRDSAPGDALATRYGPSSVLAGASAYLNHQPLAGNLEFRSYYSLKTWDKIDLLLSRMAEGRPYLLGTKGFYVGLAVVYALALLAFLFQTAKVILKEVKEGS